MHAHGSKSNSYFDTILQRFCRGCCGRCVTLRAIEQGFCASQVCSPLTFLAWRDVVFLTKSCQLTLAGDVHQWSIISYPHFDWSCCNHSSLKGNKHVSKPKMANLNMTLEICGVSRFPCCRKPPRSLFMFIWRSDLFSTFFFVFCCLVQFLRARKHKYHQDVVSHGQTRHPSSWYLKCLILIEDWYPNVIRWDVVRDHGV